MFRTALIFLFGMLLTACDQPPPQESDLGRWLGDGGEPSQGFKRAVQPRDFSFPADHGPHPGFRNEWWYLTGNLEDPNGRRFGFQVTLFRIGLQPESVVRDSEWAASEIWMAHAALSDALHEQHYHDERLVRGAMGLAGAQATPLRVWVEDWQIKGKPGFPWRLELPANDFSLQLEVQPLVDITLQGDAGLSRKSGQPGNASYYYSITRLETSGQLLMDGQQFQLSGLSWLDREWSTSVLDEDQAGWDWFALQLQDGRDLMYYQLRYRQGGRHPMSAGNLRNADGQLTPLGADIELQPVRWWRAGDGRRYPVAWQLALPETGESFRVEAVFDDQQMQTLVRYWEGMVNVYSESSNRLVGYGYLELAGY